MGEFFETITLPCPECDDGDRGCEVCSDTGTVTQQVMVSWHTIKAVYKKAADALGIPITETTPPPSSWATERRALQEQIAQLKTLLDDAAEDIEAWGGYASDYFKDKHDLPGCVAKYREAAAATDDLAPHESPTSPPASEFQAVPKALIAKIAAASSRCADPEVADLLDELLGACHDAAAQVEIVPTASLATLRTAVHQDQQLVGRLGGCSDGNCMVAGPATGMHTNGGCRCYRDPAKAMLAFRSRTNLMAAAQQVITMPAPPHPLDGVVDLAIAMASLYCELDELRYVAAALPAEEIAEHLVMKWPVVQGTGNQLAIKQLSELKHDRNRLLPSIQIILALRQSARRQPPASTPRAP